MYAKYRAFPASINVMDDSHLEEKDSTMLDSLKALLEEQIKDLYNAENQLVKTLPKLAKAASSDNLRSAFESHLELTRVHIERLAQIAKLLGTVPGGKKCKAMEGLVAEGAEVLVEKGEPALIDIALIAAARRVEHYEISAYGSAIVIAEALGEDQIVALLEKTLDEEGDADEKLGSICTEELLPAAVENSDTPKVEEMSKPRPTRKPVRT